MIDALNMMYTGFDHRVWSIDHLFLFTAFVPS